VNRAQSGYRQRRAAVALRAAGIYSPVLGNAARLLEDARVLRKSGRYESAAALAILSIEELAKFATLHPSIAAESSHRLDKDGRYLSHKQKQRTAGELLIGQLLVSEVEALLGERGYGLDVVPAGSGGTVSSISRILASASDETADPKVRQKRSKHHQFLISLLRGEFEKIKHACFYVDLDRFGAVIETVRVDRILADRIIGLASGALYTVQVELARHSKRVALRVAS